MKIDLYNNHNVFIKESQQNHAIDAFCRGHSITRAKLEQHPNIEDLATLMAFDSHEAWMTPKDQQIWRHAWAWVCHRELPLNTYHKRKLNSILDSIQYRQRNQHTMKKAITMTSKKGRPLPGSTDRPGS